MHIDYSAKGARRFLLARELEPHVIDTLIREESRPRTLSTEKGLMMVLRGINQNAGADRDDMVSLRIWAEPDLIITVRQRRVMAASEVRSELEQTKGPKSPPDLVMRLIEQLADGIALFVDDVEGRMERHEADVENCEAAEIRAEVSAVRRQVATVRRYLAPQRDALEALQRLAGKMLDAEQLYLVREQSDRMTRYVEDLDLVRERALVVQEELANRIALEQNVRARLAII
jgi:zinc transporter